MEYEEIKELNRSEKSAVYLVREKDGEQLFVRKILKGQNKIYKVLQGCPHPFLPKLYEVTVSDKETAVVEEYIEGKIPDAHEMSDKQFRRLVKELCIVLEFLHGRGIIHRDIKPSHVLLAGDGHIRLIDFDAARMPKDDLKRDTRLLGTIGYAPPEQFGFSQTDERTDIYSLGVTLEQFLGGKKRGYRRMIQKCTRLDPGKRYQSVRQVRRALFQTRRNIIYGALALVVIIFLWQMIPQSVRPGEDSAESAKLQVLPAPENPRWDGETGVGIWGNVPESGLANGSDVEYKWKLCRKDTMEPPDLADNIWERKGNMKGDILYDVDGVPTFALNLSLDLWENGFYYFAVSAVGDGVSYADSPYVISDAFEYKGEDAPPLPVPVDLEWKVDQSNGERNLFAIWSNLDDYEDQDSFNVTVYNQNGEYVINNIWTKEYLVEKMKNGNGGVWINSKFLEQEIGPFRFTVHVQSSRPNEYKSSPMPDPIPEEYFSPWYYSQN